MSAATVMPLVNPINAVWNLSRATGTERLVLLALAYCANPDGYCWLDLDQLAEMANVPVLEAQTSLAGLAESGELAVLHGENQDPRLYRVLLGQPEGTPWEWAPFGLGGEESKGQRSAISPHLRAAVYERDGHVCRCRGADKPLCLDHVIPVARGGETTFENLQTFCQQCNATKSTRDSCPCEGRGWEREVQP